MYHSRPNFMNAKFHSSSLCEVMLNLNNMLMKW
jgi:hypothetical protein